MKILHTACIVLLFLVFSCSPSEEELKTIPVAKQDTSWENGYTDCLAKAYTISYAKIVNGKIEGDVISKDVNSHKIKLTQKYINGIETGEYIEYTSEGFWKQCTYLKDSALFKRVTYMDNKLYDISYINLKGALPSIDKLSKIDYSSDEIVRSLNYATLDNYHHFNHDGILHYEQNYSQTNHEKNCEIIYYNDDGTLSGKLVRQEGKYVPDGVFVLKYGNGSIKETDSIINGRITGMHREYYPSGQIKAEFNRIDGASQGQFKEFYETGQVMKESEFVDGIIRGLITEYSELGEVIGTKESTADKVDKAIAKDEAENRKAENAEAAQKSYSTDGQKCSQCFGHYRAGFCTQCGKASGERVNESYSKAANCEYCGGSGLVTTGGIHDRKKVCPSCKGKGKQIY